MTETVTKFKPFNSKGYARNNRKHGDSACVEILVKDGDTEGEQIGEIRVWDLHPLTRLNNQNLPPTDQWEKDDDGYYKVDISEEMARSLVGAI